MRFTSGFSLILALTLLSGRTDSMNSFNGNGCQQCCTSNQNYRNNDDCCRQTEVCNCCEDQIQGKRILNLQLGSQLIRGKMPFLVSTGWQIRMEVTAQEFPKVFGREGLILKNYESCLTISKVVLISNLAKWFKMLLQIKIYKMCSCGIEGG